MRRSGNPDENKRIIMDLEVVLQSKCPFIVQCCGYFITASDVWIWYVSTIVPIPPKSQHAEK